jgi:hypothetical protein
MDVCPCYISDGLSHIHSRFSCHCRTIIDPIGISGNMTKNTASRILSELPSLKIRVVDLRGTMRVKLTYY